MVLMSFENDAPIVLKLKPLSSSKGDSSEIAIEKWKMKNDIWKICF